MNQERETEQSTQAQCKSHWKLEGRSEGLEKLRSIKDRALRAKCQCTICTALVHAQLNLKKVNCSIFYMHIEYNGIPCWLRWYSVSPFLKLISSWRLIFIMFLGHTVLRALAHCGPLCLAKQYSSSFPLQHSPNIYHLSLSLFLHSIKL